MEWYGAFLGTRDDLANVMTWIYPRWQGRAGTVPMADAPPDCLLFDIRDIALAVLLLETRVPQNEEEQHDLVARARRAQALVAERWPDRKVSVSIAVAGILPRTAERLLSHDHNVPVYDRNWIVRNVGEWGRKDMIRPLFDELDDGQPGPYGPAYDAMMRGTAPAEPGPTADEDITFPVHYGQINLLDGQGDQPDFDVLPATSVGIIGVEPGAALMMTGLHTGTVGFVVKVEDHDPGPDLDEYEDVVEISFESRDGTAALVGWAGEYSRDLPPLPAGPGSYRLRYHARGMDAGAAAQNSDEPVDEYLLQIWPAPPAPEATLKRTSRQCAYWQNHG